MATTPPLTVWFNTGELSGDMQAAALLSSMHSLCPSLRAVGMGGPYLEAAGLTTLLRMESLSVMGGVEILSILPKAYAMLCEIKKQLTQMRPHAVILVDAPEFNFRVARIAHGLGIPVYYFIPPKVWAWRTYRVHFLQKYIRKIYSILPFEPDFYASHGMDIHYVGNPLVDKVNYPSIADQTPTPHRIGIMPGSRKKELQTLLPVFGEAARLLLRNNKAYTFHALKALNIDEAQIRSLWPADIPLVVETPQNPYKFMRTCTVMLAASGTATLETALAGVPTVVAYKMAPFSAMIARRLIKVSYASLTNLIMNKEVFPEHIQENATPALVAESVERLYTDTKVRQDIFCDMDAVRAACGTCGSALRAATLLLEDMQSL